MRYWALVIIAATVLGCGEPYSTPATTAETAAPAKPDAPEKKPLPTDVPVPPGLVNRNDSTVAGSDYHVVQGQLPIAFGEAISTVRKLATSNGWAETPQQGASALASVTTLSFKKDARQLTVTLVMVDQTSTTMNLMTGPI